MVHENTREALEVEVRDAERSTAAARQRVLQERERVEATTREISTAKSALVSLGERFPRHLETLHAIRSRVTELDDEHQARARTLEHAEKLLKRWEESLATSRRRLAKQPAEAETAGSAAPKPLLIPKPTALAPGEKKHRTRPFGLPSVPPSTSDTSATRRRKRRTSRGLPRLSWGIDKDSPVVTMDAGEGTVLHLRDHLPEVVATLRATVKRLEEDNARLRQRLRDAERRLGSVENSHLDLFTQLHQQEGDLDTLRVGQQRLEELHDRLAARSTGDTRDRLDRDDDDVLFAEWNNAPTQTTMPLEGRDLRKGSVASALDVSREEEPEMIFDDEFDRDVSALIRLMGKYQVERLDTAPTRERN